MNFQRIPPAVQRLQRALNALRADVEIIGYDREPSVVLLFRDLPTTVRKRDRAAREKARADAVTAAAHWCGVAIAETRQAPRRQRTRYERVADSGPRAAPPPPPRPTTADDLRALDLDAMPDAAGLRRAWRKAAQRHHPDAGGDAEQFKRARAAYERLARQVAP